MGGGGEEKEALRVEEGLFSLESGAVPKLEESIKAQRERKSSHHNVGNSPLIQLPKT